MIQEMVLVIIQKQISIVIIENDCLYAIQAIKEDIKAPSLILNLIEDITVLTKAVKNISFIVIDQLINWLIGLPKRLIIINNFLS